MAGFPVVKKKGLDVPQGPTGHLSSTKPQPKAGGSSRTGTAGKAGLTNSPMATPLSRSLGRK